MVSVALIGADGAGKTTVASRLADTLPIPMQYIYMGVNLDACNVLFPTTRLLRAWKRSRGHAVGGSGPRDPNRPTDRPKGFVKRSLSRIKSALRLTNRMLEEVFQQSVASYYQLRGRVVVFDRHYFADYYAYDIAPSNGRRTVGQKLHGFALQSLLSRPDFVIFLDAPAEVLFARKGEGTIEILRQRRQDYLSLRDHVPHFAVVDATQSLEHVVQEVADLIVSHCRARQAAMPAVGAK